MPSVAAVAFSCEQAPATPQKQNNGQQAVRLLCVVERGILSTVFKYRLLARLMKIEA